MWSPDLVRSFVCDKFTDTYERILMKISAYVGNDTGKKMFREGVGVPDHHLDQEISSIVFILNVSVAKMFDALLECFMLFNPGATGVCSLGVLLGTL